MNSLKFAGIILASGMCLAAKAQFYSQNIVGYVNLEL